MSTAIHTSHSRFMQGSPVLLGDNTIPGVQLPEDLRELLPKIFKAVTEFGCDYYPTVVQMLTYDEMSEVAAYGGFPVRYPHWRWGMEYEELQRGYEHHRHRIFELVINTSPCYLYCLDSNTLVDNVTVVAHALGHCDFFKNNIFFSQTSQNMMNELANHGTRIRRYMTRWGKDKVSKFIDHVLRIDTLIDPAKAWERKRVRNPVIKDSREYKHPARLPISEGHDYMEPYINPKEWTDKQREKIEREEAAVQLEMFREPTKDIMRFLRNCAPLKPWQSDIMSMLYEEAMYFAPQRMTKTINEGHACIRSGLIPTDKGFIEVDDLIRNHSMVEVDDGEKHQLVFNWFEFEERETTKIVTNRGYEIDGADNHRILDTDNEWVQLGSLKVGDNLKIRPSNIWAKNLYSIEFSQKARLSQNKLCQARNISIYSFQRILGGHRLLQKGRSRSLVENEIKIKAVVDEYKEQFRESGGVATQTCRRKKIKIPNYVTTELATFLGYMVGDGHISDTRRTLGLTTGDLEQSQEYQRLVEGLFGLTSRERWDSSSKNGRWRISLSSKNLQDFLVFLGLKTGRCARKKTIPDCILKSPKSVMSAFLRAYFDCDGYAGDNGVILSTASEELGKQVQVVLLNYGILSSRKSNKDGTWHVRIGGSFTEVFRNEIGFGLVRKQDRLDEYIENRRWFCKKNWTDEIVKIEKGNATVYDISVKETHRYSALGFVNHNSWVDYNIIAKQGFAALGQDDPSAGIVEYADHKMGVLGGKYSMNPYKLGFTLLRDIEDRWNKGKFGPEWDKCTDINERKKWDKETGLGKEKVFEVRKHYNDLMLLFEFFTEDFCYDNEFFFWKKYPNGEYRIESKDPDVIKEGLIQKYLNGGLPQIRLVDPNHKGKGYMLLEHVWDGRLLYDPYVRPVLQSLYYFWQNDVLLVTKNPDDREFLYHCTGTEDSDIGIVSREDYLK